MIKFTSHGNLELLGPLLHKLREGGAQAVSSDPNLILIGAATLDEAANCLTDISFADRQKVIVVGLDEDLEYHPRPAPGSFGDFLETSRILGSLPLQMTTSWEAFGFIGPKTIAYKIGLWFGGPMHSPNYAIWAGLKDFPNVDAFLRRLVELTSSEAEFRSDDQR